MNCAVDLLTANIRYRIIHTADEYYILDMEKSIWLVFMPILLWLIPQKVYKIDAEIAKELRAPVSSGNSTAIIWLGAGGAAVLTPLVQPLLDQTIGLTVVVNLLLLMIVTAILISLRLYLRKKLHDKLYRTVDIDRLETKTIRIWPRYFTQYINPFILILFLSAFMVGSIDLFLIISNLIGLILYIMMLSLLLLLNRTFIDPRFGKKNVYRVSIVN